MKYLIICLSDIRKMIGLCLLPIVFTTFNVVFLWGQPFENTIYLDVQPTSEAYTYDFSFSSNEGINELYQELQIIGNHNQYTIGDMDGDGNFNMTSSHPLTFPTLQKVLLNAEFIVSTQNQNEIQESLDYSEPYAMPSENMSFEYAIANEECFIPLDNSHLPAPLGTNGTNCDDCSSSLIELGFEYEYEVCGASYNSCYINANGNVTFDGPYGTFTPVGFPNNSTAVMVAPFWADVDLRNCGTVYYKLESNRLIVTWDDVGYFAQNCDKRCTFQLVISDGTDPEIGIGNNTAFHYQDMEWTTGDFSGGNNGFGGSGAVVGINANDGTTFSQIGIFDHEGTDYDGQMGNDDGVSFLDNQCYSFAAGDCEITPCDISPPSFIYDGNCIYNDIQFINTSPDLADATNIFWDFGDGTTSNEENPTYVYYTPGDYTVILQLQRPDGQICEYTEIISIVGSYEVNVLQMDVSVGNSEYNVMEYATIHHYFQLTHNQQPLEGAKVTYQILGGTNSPQIFESTISDENGLIDLQIKVSGDDNYSTVDDIIAINNTGVVEFQDVVLTESIPDGFCGDTYQIGVNNFVNFVVNVGEFTARKVVGGLEFSKGLGLEGELSTQLGSNQWVSEIEGGGSLKGTLGARLGLGLDFAGAFSELSGVGVSVSGQGNISGELFAELDLQEKLWIPEVELDANAKLNANIFLDANFNNLNAPFFTDEQSAYLMYTFAELGTLGLTSGMTYALKNSIGEVFQDLGEPPLTLDYGINAGIGVSAGFAGEIPIISNSDLDFDIDLDAGFAPQSVINAGIKSTLFDGSPSLEFYGSRYTGVNYEPDDFAIETEVFTLDFISPHQFGNGVKTAGLVDKVDLSLNGYYIQFFKSDSKVIEGQKRSLEYDAQYTFTDDAVEIIDNLGIAPDVLASLINGENNIFYLDMSTYNAQLNTLLSDAISDNFSTGDLKLEESKTYEWKIDLDVGYSPEALMPKVPIESKKIIEIGGFLKHKYPIEKSIFSEQLKQVLIIEEYPDDENLVEFPNQLPYGIQAGLVESAQTVIDLFGPDAFNFINISEGDVANGFVTLVNTLRDGDYLKNGYKYNFEDFSTLAYTFPDDASVFNQGTDVTLYYFYTGGDVGGVTQDSIPFVALSDLFYFTAIDGTDTLDVAPNGNFSLDVHVGQNDLDYLGFPEDIAVRLYYRPFGDYLWENLSVISADTTLSLNMMGEYTLGVDFMQDSIPPLVEFTNLSTFNDDGYISATIEDEDSGIDWRSVMFSINGVPVSHERVDFTSEIRIDIDSLPNGLSGQQQIYVQGYDLQENYGYDVEYLEYYDGVCPNPDACNYDPAATEDESECIFPGDDCDDNNPLTENDIVQEDCTCLGTDIDTSTDCSMIGVGVEIYCEDMGTEEISDDVFYFTLEPNGDNFSGSYTVSGDVDIPNIPYGLSPMAYGPYLTGTVLNITLTDDNDPNCSFSTTVEYICGGGGVPTVGEWGLIILALILLNLGVLYIRQTEIRIEEA